MNILAVFFPELQSYGVIKMWLVSINGGSGARLIMMFQKQHQHGNIKPCVRLHGSTGAAVLFTWSMFTWVLFWLSQCLIVQTVMKQRAHLECLWYYSENCIYCITIVSSLKVMYKSLVGHHMTLAFQMVATVPKSSQTPALLSWFQTCRLAGPLFVEFVCTSCVSVGLLHCSLTVHRSFISCWQVC